jgi:hypothetical protein
MARNRVQFQKGLGLAEFNMCYGTEVQCHAALIEMLGRMALSVRSGAMPESW